MLSFVRRISSVLRNATRQPDRQLGTSGQLTNAGLSTLLKTEPTVTLRSLAFLDGNVSPLEILTIAALVADSAPRCIFEIGTFNGNTTLQIAQNAPSESRVFTLDLPLGANGATAKSVDDEDIKYIRSAARPMRRYVGSPVAGKITELFGDSALLDYREALRGQEINFAFIDGSHSYEYVKSDTEHILAHLAPDGIVLWHDYHPFWSGVCKYLNELKSTRSLIHIEGTTLAYYRASDRDKALAEPSSL